ncbi:MAG: hypothetical protein K0R34_1732 [Herbinix sp.]|nr:hypothetical protein [Herbinix sp.]
MEAAVIMEAAVEMEKDVVVTNHPIHKEHLTLAIGDYSIDIVSDNDELGHLAIPDLAMKFLDTEVTYHPSYTIQLMINPSEYWEPDSAPIAGFTEGPVPYLIYRLQEDEYLWIRKDRFDIPRVVYRISNQWNCWELLYNHDDSSDYCSFNELAFLFPYSILNKNGVLFHGVVMEWKSMGVLVCACAGTGKTTHTKMWKEVENASILNGDRALCCYVDHQWYTYGAPWNGSSGECINRRVPLRAIVLLEQADNNQIARLTPLQGILGLIPVTFAPDWDEKQMNRAIDTIEQIGMQVPIYALYCKPNLEALEILKGELEKLIDMERNW